MNPQPPQREDEPVNRTRRPVDPTTRVLFAATILIAFSTAGASAAGIVPREGGGSPWQTAL
jgi:hypothetical protein